MKQSTPPSMRPDKSGAGMLVSVKDEAPHWKYRDDSNVPWHEHWTAHPFRVVRKTEFGRSGWRAIGGINLRHGSPFGLRIQCNVIMNTRFEALCMLPSEKNGVRRVSQFAMDTAELRDSFLRWATLVWLLAVKRFKGVLPYATVQGRSGLFYVVRGDGQLDIEDDWFERVARESEEKLGYGRGDAPDRGDLERFSVLPGGDGEDRDGGEGD